MNLYRSWAFEEMDCSLERTWNEEQHGGLVISVVLMQVFKSNCSPLTSTLQQEKNVSIFINSQGGIFPLTKTICPCKGMLLSVLQYSFLIQLYLSWIHEENKTVLLLWKSAGHSTSKRIYSQTSLFLLGIYRTTPDSIPLHIHAQPHKYQRNVQKSVLSSSISHMSYFRAECDFAMQEQKNGRLSSLRLIWKIQHQHVNVLFLTS